jgi:hypothetical protein
MLLGDAGHAAIDALAAFTLDEAPQFKCIGRHPMGLDLLESFVVRD